MGREGRCGEASLRKSAAARAATSLQRAAEKLWCPRSAHWSSWSAGRPVEGSGSPSGTPTSVEPSARHCSSKPGGHGELRDQAWVLSRRNYWCWCGCCWRCYFCCFC